MRFIAQVWLKKERCAIAGAGRSSRIYFLVNLLHYRTMQENKDKSISIEDLKKHLESKLPKLSPGQKVAPEDEKCINFALDLYLWAKEQSQ